MKRTIRRRLRAGFSMFEMLTVLGVVSILLAISGPWMKDQVTEHRTNQVTMSVFADLVLAKSEALRRQQDVIVIFDTSNNRYSILVDNGSDWALGQTPGAGDYYLKQNVALPKDYAFAGRSYGIYGVDNEGMGTGVTLKDGLLFIQPSGRMSDAHADSLSTLVKSNNRAIYIARRDLPRNDNYGHMRAIVADGISGQPKIYRFNGAWVTRD